MKLESPPVNIQLRLPLIKMLLQSPPNQDTATTTLNQNTGTITPNQRSPPIKMQLQLPPDQLQPPGPIMIHSHWSNIRDKKKVIFWWKSVDYYEMHNMNIISWNIKFVLRQNKYKFRMRKTADKYFEKKEFKGKIFSASVCRWNKRK